MKLLLSLLLALPCFAEQTLTKKDLMEGLKIPERREFPLSKKFKPCQDFYQYVCEPVVSSFELPKDRSRWSFSFTDLDEKILHARKKYLKHLEKFEPSSARGKGLRNFYLSCMNEKASAAEEKNIVQEKLAMMNQIQTREQLIEFLGNQITTPYFKFLAYGADADQDNPDILSVIIATEGQTFPEKSYYAKASNVQALRSLVTEFFKAIGIKNPDSHAKNVVDFEVAYSKADLTKAEYRDRYSSRNAVERSKLLADYPSLKLEKLFSKIPKKTVVRAIAPETLQFMENAIQTMPIEQLKDVYTYHLLDSYLDDAYPQFFSKRFKFKHDILGGSEKRPPRDERCAKEIDQSFGKELDTELISILFKDFPADQVETLVAKIRDSLLKEISENTWLSTQGKEEAIRKIKTAKLFLVKPRNDKEWDYNPIGNYSPNSVYANRHQLGELLIGKEFKELTEPRNKVKWWLGPLTLNAYYSPDDNKFVLLQGILQYPFFDPTSTLIENLAAIGMVTGHELGHGIDDQGSKYDSDGKLRDWLTKEDLSAFKERTKKFVTQYDRIGHNGKLTLGENIGDHVGLTAAYRAAFGKEGLGSVEDKQKFFSSYAKAWCNKALPKYEEMQLKTNPHALGFARVNQQVMHLQGFYDAFSCKSGDKMYLDPKDRIKVW